MSQIGSRLKENDYRFERLDINLERAQEMFKDNAYKLEQLPSIAAKSESENHVTLYRVGDHVDISRGPMISSTAHLGRFDITAVSLNINLFTHIYSR